MTKQQIKDTLSFLKEKFEKDMDEADSPIERKMLEREYLKNAELVEAGNNIWESNRPDDSDYQCEGCGA